MPVPYSLPISITLGLIVFALAAQWYVVPWLRRTPPAESLPPFLLFHSLRYVGLAFLIPGVTAEALDPRFAQPAAWGDLAAALLALTAVLALKARARVAIPLVWMFSVAGTLDLVNALWQGFRYAPDGHLGATYFIPAVIVPALLVTHGLIFYVLIRHWAGRERLARDHQGR